MGKVFVNALAARQGGGVTYLRELIAQLGQYPEYIFDVYGFGAEAGDKLPENVRLIKALRFANKYLGRFFIEKIYLPIFIKCNRYNIAFFPNGYVSSWVPSSCKAVVMFRNMIPFDKEVLVRFGRYKRLRYKVLKCLYLKSYRRADHVIFISKYAQNVIKSIIDDISRYSSVIPHGVSRSFQLHEALPTLSKGHILYVSIYNSYKHQVELVRGLKLFLKKHGWAPKLDLVGYHTPYSAELAQCVIDLDLTSHVTVVGPVARGRLNFYYQKARLFVFASSCENCPNILLEAMRSGRPILCSDRMPMPEFLGEEGVYFDPLSPASFCHKLEEVYCSDAILAKMANDSLRRSFLYTWEKTVGETISVFKKITDS